MIRIMDSKSRKYEDYELLSHILTAGLDNFCTKDCNTCQAKRVCSSVYSAAGYAIILAGKHTT